MERATGWRRDDEDDDEDPDPDPDGETPASPLDLAAAGTSRWAAEWVRRSEDPGLKGEKSC